MNERRLVTETRKVRLVLGNGRDLEGDFFLQIVSPHHAGPQRVGELINGEERFIPLRSGSDVHLINLDQVVSIQVDRATELDPLMLLGEPHQVSFETILGHQFSAEIHVNLPGSRGRVKDFLNIEDRFVPCLLPKQICYLNPRFLLTVQD